MKIIETNVKSEKGITLIALIITIIVLIILASIITYSGISSIKSSKFLEFRSELEMMQTQVDYLNEEYTRLENNGEDGEAYIQSKGKDLTYSADEQESFDGAGVTDKTNYRYYDKASVDDLGLTGLQYEFLVSVKDRKVIAIGGLEYEGTKYYTLDQIRESPEVGNLERGDVTVDSVDYEHIEDAKYKITVTNIQCSKYVTKYTIQYRNVDLADTYSTLGKLITDENFTFEVDGEGTYEILITDAAGKTFSQNITVRRYIIKYDANGGEGAPTQQIKFHNKNLTLQTGIPTREGYDFLGWAETATATTGQYQPGGTFTKNADTTLYAVWKIKTYTIKYNVGNGTGSIPNQTKTHGINITLSTTRPTPKDSKYEFKGWSESANGNVQYQPGATFTKNANTTLYAIYQLKTYTISYNANGGSGAPGNQTKTHGVNLKLSSTKPTRSGYTFQGWSESAGGSVQYQPGGTFTKNENKTLYAIWKRNTWTVTFHANGGRFSNGSETYSVEVNQGDSITLPNSPYAPNVGGGWTMAARFEGWATAEGRTYANGGSHINVGKAGASYTPNKNITIYAYWHTSLEDFENVNAYQNVTYIKNGTTPIITTDGSKISVRLDVSLQAFSYDYYRFYVYGSNDGSNWQRLASTNGYTQSYTLIFPGSADSQGYNWKQYFSGYKYYQFSYNIKGQYSGLRNDGYVVSCSGDLQIGF